MSLAEPEPCPGCGVVLPRETGPTHAYLASSPACWARYGEVLAREFGDPERFRLHQLTVDSYAVQHPGGDDRRAIQSVGLHLMTLCAVLERGADPADGPRLHKRIVGRPAFRWLEPPSFEGRMKAVDLLPAEDVATHLELVRAWADDAWAAWRPHHDQVRDWLDAALGGVRRS